MELSTLVTIVISGVGTGFLACGIAIKVLAVHFKTVVTERITKLEAALATMDARNDALNLYIRENLATMLAESMAREKNIQRLIRRCPELARAIASEDDSGKMPINGHHKTPRPG